ncbi:MAG: winged helix-turn-helix transcriptional regulator [Candidatus Aenigmarchaeota archaeon]|nr:winged helix-turn-helix transcriptional regulator [Candidatus Aenigmarchaeota archaeon]
MPEVLDKDTIKAISAEARQEILKMLAKRPYTASEIAKATGKHVTTVTEHLEVLEKSSLVHKKESSNKWVYYELTSRGEHFFKPQFYSWIIVFSLSVVFVFIGMLRLFRFETAAGVEMASKSDALQAPASAALTAPVDYIAYILIILGTIGLLYLVYRKYRNQ